MVTLFGTDGVRGVVNSTLMPELAFQLGRAAGAYFCNCLLYTSDAADEL